MSINDLAERIHTIAHDHGFWPETGRDFGEMLALIRSELSESLEQHREGKPNVYHVLVTDDDTPEEARDIVGDIMAYEAQGQTPPDPLLGAAASFGVRKPEGVLVELADASIRILDTLHSFSVSISESMQNIPTPNLSSSTFGASLEDINLMLSQAWLAQSQVAVEGGDVVKPVCGYLLTALLALDSLARRIAPERDFTEVIEEKVFFNSKRPFKHGKAY